MVHYSPLLLKGIAMTDFNKSMKAPDFKLGTFSLSHELKKGPLLLTFYKKTCPTCQFTYPFFEKLHEHYTSPTFQVVGIGQDPETKEFSQAYGITFPMVSDTPNYDVSRQYHLTTVPTAFLVNPDKSIDYVSIGFAKKDLEDICQLISTRTKKSTLEIFKGVDVPAMKAG